MEVRQRRLRYAMWYGLLIFMVLGYGGCNGSSNQNDVLGDNQGTQVRVAFTRQVNGETDNSEKTRLTLTVSGPGITSSNNLTDIPIDAETRSLVLNVPVGKDRRFVVEAFSSLADFPTFYGEKTIDVLADTKNEVTIAIDPTAVFTLGTSRLDDPTQRLQ